MISFAKEMSMERMFGGAVDMGWHDSGIGVGNALVPAMTIGGVLVCDINNPAGTENNDMVAAVVADLQNFLKDVKCCAL